MVDIKKFFWMIHYVKKIKIKTCTNKSMLKLSLIKLK